MWDFDTDYDADYGDMDGEFDLAPAHREHLSEANGSDEDEWEAEDGEEHEDYDGDDGFDPEVDEDGWLDGSYEE